MPPIDETLENFLHRWGPDYSVRVIEESPLQIVISSDMPGDGQTANFLVEENAVRCVAITLPPEEDIPY